jgi:hypothetical protein
MIEQLTEQAVPGASVAECAACDGTRLVAGAAGTFNACPSCVAPAAPAPPREQFIKLPSFLVPSLARPLDSMEMEEWTIGSFLASFVSSHDGASPPLATLATIAGVNADTAKRVLERMKLKGWVGMAKIRNQWEPGSWGLKWRFWIPTGSPLLELMGKRSKTPWVPVPIAVARSKSPLVVGAYLALHEQQRIDGAITTTATDLAGILACHPRTARRLLVGLGCKAVGTPVPGCAVYVMEIPRAGAKLVGHLELGPFLFDVMGRSEEALEAACSRRDELAELLSRHGVNIAELVAQLVPDGRCMTSGAHPTAAAVLRLIEEHHRTKLMLDTGYRRRLWRRFSSHLRHAKMDRAVRAAKANASEWKQVREEALQAINRACPTCHGDHLVEQDDGRWSACPSCT